MPCINADSLGFAFVCSVFVIVVFAFLLCVFVLALVFSARFTLDLRASKIAG